MQGEKHVQGATGSTHLTQAALRALLCVLTGAAVGM